MTKTTSILTVALAMFSFTVFAQELQNKADAIKTIEQAIGGRFLRESMSIDKQSIRWEFLNGACRGFPVIVDLISYPSLEQAKAASIAAFSQAEYDYTWLIEQNHKLTGAEPATETVDQYLERQDRQKLGH
jgi:hypothetical protein